VSESVKIWYFQQKIRKIFYGGTQPLPRPSPKWRGECPSPLSTPRRLRHLEPSHSKILGTPLNYRYIFSVVNIWLCIRNIVPGFHYAVTGNRVYMYVLIEPLTMTLSCVYLSHLSAWPISRTYSTCHQDETNTKLANFSYCSIQIQDMFKNTSILQFHCDFWASCFFSFSSAGQLLTT